MNYIKKKELIFLVIFYTLVALIILFTLLDRKKEASASASYTSSQKITGVTVTAYCPSACCNEQWAGLTAKGPSMEYYITKGFNICAVDPTIIPLDSIIEYDGVKYLCVDVGYLIKGKKIDILLMTHEQANHFGIKLNQTIYVHKEVKND
jgi:3D (Asp-Asp-Asp) domain-containing protein